MLTTFAEFSRGRDKKKRHRNKLKLVSSAVSTHVSGRASVPIPQGEIYAKGMVHVSKSGHHPAGDYSSTRFLKRGISLRYRADAFGKEIRNAGFIGYRQSSDKRDAVDAERRF